MCVTVLFQKGLLMNKQLAIKNLHLHYLTETASLALRLQQADNVTLADGANNVADDRGTDTTTSRTLRAELGTDLGDTTAGTSATENLDDADVYFLAFLSLVSG